MKDFFVSLLTVSLIWAIFYFFAVDGKNEEIISKDCYPKIQIINNAKLVISFTDPDFGWDEEKFLELTKETQHANFFCTLYDETLRELLSVLRTFFVIR